MAISPPLLADCLSNLEYATNIHQQYIDAPNTTTTKESVTILNNALTAYNSAESSCRNDSESSEILTKNWNFAACSYFWEYTYLLHDKGGNYLLDEKNYKLASHYYKASIKYSDAYINKCHQKPDNVDRMRELKQIAKRQITRSKILSGINSK